jgi:hypothetical protein
MTTKLICTLSFLIILSACNQTQNNAADKSYSDTTLVKKSTTSEAVLKEYQKFVSKLDTLNVETATVAANKYQDLFQKEDVSVRDKGFIIFNNHYEKLDRGINEVHEKDTTDFDPLIMVDISGKSLPVSQKLKDYDEKLKKNGFQVSSTEGMSYIQQDRDFIAKWFYSYVSPQMKEYLQQLNKENKEGFQEDAGLAIEAKQYVNRIVWWDKFIQKNQGFPLIDEAKEHRKYLLTFLLIGMDNSPILSYETNTLDDYYSTAYTYLQNSYPNSETNKIVNPYFKALLQNDNKKATTLLNDYKKKGVIVDFGEGL